MTGAAQRAEAGLAGLAVQLARGLPPPPVAISISACPCPAAACRFTPIFSPPLPPPLPAGPFRSSHHPCLRPCLPGPFRSSHHPCLRPCLPVHTVLLTTPASCPSSSPLQRRLGCPLTPTSLTTWSSTGKQPGSLHSLGVLPGAALFWDACLPGARVHCSSANRQPSARAKHPSVAVPAARRVFIEDANVNPALPMLHALARLVFPIAFSFLLIKFAFRYVHLCCIG